VLACIISGLSIFLQFISLLPLGYVLCHLYISYYYLYRRKNTPGLWIKCRVDNKLQVGDNALKLRFKMQLESSMQHKDSLSILRQGIVF
jgi:hypothetical protein